MPRHPTGLDTRMGAPAREESIRRTVISTLELGHAGQFASRVAKSADEALAKRDTEGQAQDICLPGPFD
jgi:hypothetical protein